jgi:hypothetical protein
MNKGVMQFHFQQSKKTFMREIALKGIKEPALKETMTGINLKEFISAKLAMPLLMQICR